MSVPIGTDPDKQGQAETICDICKHLCPSAKLCCFNLKTSLWHWWYWLMLTLPDFMISEAATSTPHSACQHLHYRCSHLWHSSSGLVSLFHIAPVSSSQRVLQAIWDDSGFNGELQIEVFSSVNELLSVNPDLLQQILKHAELRERLFQHFMFYYFPSNSIKLNFKDMMTVSEVSPTLWTKRLIAAPRGPASCCHSDLCHPALVCQEQPAAAYGPCTWNTVIYSCSHWCTLTDTEDH